MAIRCNYGFSHNVPPNQTPMFIFNYLSSPRSRKIAINRLLAYLQPQVSAQKLCKCKRSAYRLSLSPLVSAHSHLLRRYTTFTNPFVNARLEIQLIQTLGVHAKPVSRVTIATAIKSDFRRGEQKREQDKNDPLGGRGRTGEQSGSRLDNGSLKTRHARQLVADEKTVAFQHARAS